MILFVIFSFHFLSFRSPTSSFPFPLLSLPCLWLIPLSTWILFSFPTFLYAFRSSLHCLSLPTSPSPSLCLPPSCFILLPSIFLFSLSPFFLSPHSSLFLFPPPPLSSFFPFA